VETDRSAVAARETGGPYRDEAASVEAFLDDWLYTGDTGSLSADGYLTVTGRKKDLIITSSGKNITPVNIESALRETRWISRPSSTEIAVPTSLAW
jgi:long-chain acyl-CoA synthetase